MFALESWCLPDFRSSYLKNDAISPENKQRHQRCQVYFIGPLKHKLSGTVGFLVRTFFGALVGICNKIWEGPGTFSDKGCLPF